MTRKCLIRTLHTNAQHRVEKRKPVSWISDQVKQKSVCLATETILDSEITLEKCFDIMKISN